MHAHNTWWIPKKLNINDMKKASKYLIGNHDFSSFRASGCQASSPIKTIKKITIYKKNNTITLTFIARSFLYNQVRIMTGTLKDVGSGLIAPVQLKEIIRKKKGCMQV